MKLYGLIGYPLGHSFSKKHFTEKFEGESIDSKYELFEIETIEKFPTLIQAHVLSGLNVTIPYKEAVIPYLDELDETARQIGAVNVIKFIRNGKSFTLKGYNSDVIGFEKSISKYIKTHYKKALILGTGGASKAIDFGLRKMGIETTFVSRTPKHNQLEYSDLNKNILSDNLIIVNTTPVGMFPHEDECPDIPYRFITTEHLLFDAIYNPTETLFLRKGKEQGAQTLNGLEMLEGQAVAAWDIWEGIIH